MKFLPLLLFLVVMPSLRAAGINPDASNLFTVIELKLQQPTPGFRIQIAKISSDTFVDPPPQLNSFEGLAAFSVTFKPSPHKKAILAAIASGRASYWEPVQSPAYPRWCIRFIGPWSEVLGAILIDENNAEICIVNQWYKVDASFLHKLTNILLHEVLEKDDPLSRAAH